MTKINVESERDPIRDSFAANKEFGEAHDQWIMATIIDACKPFWIEEFREPCQKST